MISLLFVICCQVANDKDLGEEHTKSTNCFLAEQYKHKVTGHPCMSSLLVQKRRAHRKTNKQTETLFCSFVKANKLHRLHSHGHTIVISSFFIMHLICFSVFLVIHICILLNLYSYFLRPEKPYNVAKVWHTEILIVSLLTNTQESLDTHTIGFTTSVSIYHCLECGISILCNVCNMFIQLSLKQHSSDYITEHNSVLMLPYLFSVCAADTTHDAFWLRAHL